jgi:dTDP-4-amino-4,6-dideoxygalactose transaminase
LLNHARSGIVMALRAALPKGGRVGVVAYNCHTVANAVVESECNPVFVDVTENLRVDLQYLAGLQLDAIIVTNLFGIHNDIAAIRAAQPNAIIIVDNAHGYGLPAEGDFTVYSINQGKFPALGEGGILYVDNPAYAESIQTQYASLKGYSITQETKLYLTMLLKSLMHTPWIYRALTLRMKQKRTSVACRSKVVLKRMAKGVSSMYQPALPTIPQEIAQQQRNAQTIAHYLLNQKWTLHTWWGDNAFMLIAQTSDTEALKNHLLQHGVETATHFARAIEWAKEFGYTEGQCPMAERLTKELIMIPTYAPRRR